LVRKRKDVDRKTKLEFDRNLSERLSDWNSVLDAVIAQKSTFTFIVENQTENFRKVSS